MWNKYATNATNQFYINDTVHSSANSTRTSNCCTWQTLTAQWCELYRESASTEIRTQWGIETSVHCVHTGRMVWKWQGGAVRSLRDWALDERWESWVLIPPNHLSTGTFVATWRQIQLITVTTILLPFSFKDKTSDLLSETIKTLTSQSPSNTISEGVVVSQFDIHIRQLFMFYHKHVYVLWWTDCFHKTAQ